MADSQPTAPNPSRATVRAVDRTLSDVLCDMGQAAQLLSELAELVMEARGGAGRSPPMYAIQRLIESAHDQVEAAYQALDEAQAMSRPYADGREEAAQPPLPQRPDQLSLLDQAAWQLAYTEECEKADDNEPHRDVLRRAMARVHKLIATRAAPAPQAA